MVSIRLFGIDPQRVRSKVNLLLDDQDAYLKMANAVNLEQQPDASARL